MVWEKVWVIKCATWSCRKYWKSVLQVGKKFGLRGTKRQPGRVEQLFSHIHKVSHVVTAFVFGVGVGV